MKKFTVGVKGNVLEWFELPIWTLFEEEREETDSF